jgi:hypothetical protein
VARERAAWRRREAAKVASAAQGGAGHGA